MESSNTTSWGWLILLTIFLTIIWYSLSTIMDIAEISTNWQKFRCSPVVMPFASLYGYDTSQNFNYCLTTIFKGQVGGVTGPFATILATMTSSLMTFLNNLNSMRIMIATLVGGITKVLQEFTDRFKLLFSQIKLAFLKMQMIMKRLHGSFQSFIYLGLSAVQTGTNFMDTFIFSFIDTFCFAPETQINVLEKGNIQIDQVTLGDILSNNAEVISTYKFMANGQKMVSLNGTIVSTNHFVNHDGKYIEAKDHPNAVPIASWVGGSERPLICLDTSTHKIPINNHEFLDWDETNDIDEKLMEQNEYTLNNSYANKPRPWIFQPAIEKTAKIICGDGSFKTCEQIQLGDQLSTGRVVGIGKRFIYSWTSLPSGIDVTPSTLFWSENYWMRAGHKGEIKHSKTPRIFYTFVVLGTNIELSSGEYLKDMCEIHSPQTENIVRTFFAPEL
jgi:hypothetical protein